MKLDQYGIRQNEKQINSLVDLLLAAEEYQKWDYMGLIVEIDPTVDFNNNNVLVRWTELNEGFNDKILVNSKSEFVNHFSKINL